MVVNAKKIVTIGTFDIFFRWWGKYRWKETRSPTFEQVICGKGTGRYLQNQIFEVNKNVF